MNRLCCLVSAMGASAFGLTADETRAQARTSAESPKSEIIVTGERIDRPLQATASSVTVIDADGLTQRAAADRLDDLLAFIPNVQLGTGSEGPAIRGQDTTGVLRDLPAFLGGTRARVTLQVDGRPVGYNEFVFGTAPLWDVAQVEVFRSPQTTTQGRNAIAGAIFVRTQDPAHAWEGAARLLTGNYDTRQGSVMISGPIVRDQFSFRVAADLRRARVSGEIGNRIEGTDPNEDAFGLVRVKLRAEPHALPGLRIDATYVHSEAKAPQIVGVVRPFRERRDPRAGYGVFEVDVDSLTGELRYDLSPTLASRTTLSGGESFIRRFAPRGLGQTVTDSSDRSVESILTWRPAPAVQTVGGVHYLHSRLEQVIDLSAVVGAGTFGDRQHSLGLFGEATLRPLPGLALTAGLRYQRDRQDRTGFLGSPAFGFSTDYHRTFDAWLPKLSIGYDFAPGVTAGILVQRAYNPGGSSINFETGAPIDFGAETLWNYEMFARGRFGGVTLAANLFYNRFRNAQRAEPRSFTAPGGAVAGWALIANVPAAESYGLELELDWRASRRLTLRAGLGLLETKIIETLRPTDPIRGKDFQRAPKLTASAALDWRPFDALRLSAQLRHNSAYFSNDANTPALRVSGSTTLDTRASYAIGPVALFGYARNLFDRFAMLSLFNLVNAQAANGVAADPRELGIGVEARF